MAPVRSIFEARKTLTYDALSEFDDGQMLPGTPEFFLGAFLLLGKTPPFPGTLKRSWEYPSPP
jgi:hypothetical protein